MKRILSVVLTLTLLLGGSVLAESWICPQCGNEASGNFCSNCGASRTGVFEEDSLVFQALSEDTAEVIGYKGSEDTVTIYSEVNGYKIVSIGAEAFRDKKTIGSFLILADIESIGEAAFAGCSELGSFTTSASTKELGAGAFEGCTSLKTILLFGDIKTIPSNAFKDCTSLESINIPSEAERICTSAFEGCTNLKTVFIWNDDIVVEPDAFKGCAYTYDYEGQAPGDANATGLEESGEMAPDTNGVQSETMYNVELNVNFIPNILFSTYDVRLLIDDEEMDVLPHGKDANYEYTLAGGTHTISFENADDPSVDGELTLDVSSDLAVEYKIYCTSEYVDVDEEYVDREVELAESAEKAEEEANPTDEPLPTEEPSPTNEPLPTEEPSPTNEPLPAEEPSPTDEPLPTEEPSPTEESLPPVHLESGSKGEDVRRLQQYLIALGCLNDKADGDYGKKTSAAVQAFQEANGLETTGKVETADMAAIRAAIREQARRAVVVAMTNGSAMDVFSPDGNSYDTSKFHSYADTSGFHLIVHTDGNWSGGSDDRWHVDHFILEMVGYTYLKVSCDVSFDGNNYIVSDVTKVTGDLQYLDTDDESKLNIEQMEPSDFNSFLTVAPPLVREARPGDETSAGVEMQATSQTDESASIPDDEVSLQELLTLNREEDEDKIANFARVNSGNTISLELLTAFVEPYRDYDTRFNYLLYAVVGDNVMMAGPAFMFKNVNYGDLKLTGSNIPSTFDTGIHCRVTAEVEGYEDGMILLDPISTEVIQEY